MKAQQLEYQAAIIGLKESLEKESKQNQAQAADLQATEHKLREREARQRALEEELAASRETLKGVETELTQTRKQLAEGPENRINPVFYALGADENAAEAERVLRDVQSILGKRADASFSIIGFASRDGNAQANLRLSAQRAEKLSLFLKKNGVPAERITIGSAVINPNASGKAVDRGSEP
jgi:outer membrane protein OmpA-like peptidoglycan-associated protein